MMVWAPDILHQVAGGADMGNIIDLAIKEFQGKLRSDEGSVAGTGDVATLTANTGKDMYLASAKITVSWNQSTTANREVLVQLKLNTVNIEPVRIVFLEGGTRTGNVATIPYEFKNIGRKVLTGEIIKLEIISNSGNVATVTGMIECFEEDTGASPQIT